MSTRWCARCPSTRRSTALHAAPGNPGHRRAGHAARGRPARRRRGRRARHVAGCGPRRRRTRGAARRGGRRRGARRRASPCSGRRPRAPGSRAPRRSPRRSWPPRACRPPSRASRRRSTRSRPGSTRSAPPYVVKDDGLAAGKGVVVTDDRAEALAHAAVCLAKPGGRVVVEDYLDGPEVSLFVPLRRRRRGPARPRAGLQARARRRRRAQHGRHGRVLAAAVGARRAWSTRSSSGSPARPSTEMARRGHAVLGRPLRRARADLDGLRVVEFNARFGDPETQVVLARLATPLAAVLLASADRARSRALPPLRWRDDAAVTVVVASHGYPATAAVGRPDHRPRGRRGAPRGARAARRHRARRRTARLVARRAGACCPSSASAPTSRPRAPPPTRGSSGSTCRLAPPLGHRRRGRGPPPV